ncbi:MAG: radical SAM protein [Candidatus Heimdallarchaeota archaeon]
MTLKCTFECDHCFLYCSPDAEGTFNLKQLMILLDELAKLEQAKTIFFEGGEPFLFYPLLMEGIRRADELGFNIGIVSNGYWATTVDDAVLWLSPLVNRNIVDVSISDDTFHYGEVVNNTAKNAVSALRQLGIPCGSICIDPPVIETSENQEKGAPIIGGNARFRGRAVEKLVEGLPKRPASDLLPECPYEDLENPGRVHVDPFGHVHLCQGLSLGNMWDIPLSELILSYDANTHPIAGPLLKGGPHELAKTYGINGDASYVDECHYCYSVRKQLLDRFPKYLAPRQVYGFPP